MTPGGRIVLAGVLAAAASAAVAAQTPVMPPPAAPVYRFEPLPGTLSELSKRFTAAQIELLEMINRRDREHLVRTDPPVPGLIVPDVWHADPLAYSPFPPAWPSAETHAKAIVVHQPMQAFAAYEYGRLIRWGPVSSGRKETPTPEGTFHLTWRARSRRSTDNQDWLLEWYFNFVNARGISFHLFDLPGYPASHACVRLLLRDAQWLYGWGQQWKLDATGRIVTEKGTPVVIHGSYGFGDPAPWLSLDALSVPLGMPAIVAAPVPDVADVAVAGPPSPAR